MYVCVCLRVDVCEHGRAEIGQGPEHTEMRPPPPLLALCPLFPVYIFPSL